jgi:sigma-B regulation protein RsbU (phosphoserine phosphatase)
MNTGAEFTGRRPRAKSARVDEKYVRILFVEDRTDVAEEIRDTLGRAGRGSFEVIRETNLVHAVAQIEGEIFDLLLLDLSLANLARSTAIDLANDLAHRLPVVVLTGIEELREELSPIEKGFKACIENADLPGKLLAAIRRSRRLGTGVMSPLFCRIEGLRG